MNHPVRQFLGASVFLLFASNSFATPFLDPIGDAQIGAFRTYDIASANATFDNTNLYFNIQLSGNGPLAPSIAGNSGLYGFIDIDIDQSNSTGATSTISTLVPPLFGNSGLGIEYYIDLFFEAGNPGFVQVRDPINVSNVNPVTISYGTSAFSITVPLAFIGNDDGLVNYAVVVGDFGNATDQVLDATRPPGTLPASSSFQSQVPAPVSEPGAVFLILTGLAAMLSARSLRHRDPDVANYLTIA